MSKSEEPDTESEDLDIEFEEVDDAEVDNETSYKHSHNGPCSIE